MSRASWRQSAQPRADVCVAETEAPAWRSSLAAAWVAQFVAVMAFSFAAPFIPFYVRELGVREERMVAVWAGMLGAATGLTLALLAPLWGILADRYSRKLMVERAMFGGALAVSLMALARSPYHLLLLRILQGLLSGTIPASVALVSGFTPPARRGYSLGLMQMAVFAGAALGPLIGGSMADRFGFRWPFALAGLLLCCGGTIVIFGVDESLSSPNNGGNGASASLTELLTYRHLIPLMGLFFLIMLAGTMVAPILPLFVEQLAKSSTAIAGLVGLLMGGVGLVAGLGAAGIGRLSDRIGPRTAFVGSTFFGGLLTAAQALVGSVGALFTTRLVAAVASGGIQPTLNAIIARAVPENAYGRAYGITSSARAIGMGIGPLMGGVIAAHLGLRAPFLISGSILVLTSLATAWLVRRRSRAGKS